MQQMRDHDRDERQPPRRASPPRRTARREGFFTAGREAVDAYLAARGEADTAGVLRLRAILSAKEAEAYRDRVTDLRENWR